MEFFMSLYFIAIAPDSILSERIRLIQKDFAERFDSKKSYSNFPHITIIPPFNNEKIHENEIIRRFKKLNIKTKPLEIFLDGFDCFPNKKNPVIFIKPKFSEDLNNLHQEIAGKNIHFYPHLTVAYRDLTYENFEKAWHEYENKSFKASLNVKSAGLYKHFNSKWNLIAENNLF